MTYKFSDSVLPPSKGGTRIVVWEDAETWASVLPRLTDIGFTGILLVVANSDFTSKVVAAGSYDLGNLEIIGIAGSNPAAAIVNVNLAEGVLLAGSMYLSNMAIVSQATATPHITTADGFVWRLKNCSLSGSFTVSFAHISGGNTQILMEASSMNSGGSSSHPFFDITNGNGASYVLYNGSSLFYFIQTNAASVANVTLDSGSYYLPHGGDPTQAFQGITVSKTLVDFSAGMSYDDNVSSPPLSVSDVQGAIDELKSTYAPLTSVPVKVASDAPINQSAAIAATTIYTTPAPGLYRISWVAHIRTAASVSSVLGGAALGLQVVYTDMDNSQVTTTQANLSGSTSAGNTTTTVAGGVIIVAADGSTDIQYQFGYTSSGTPMAYNLHIVVEAL